jgi:hypothetical protein
MKARLARFEDHTAIQNRGKLLQAFFYVPIPELDVAAPSLVPNWIEINEDVQTAMKPPVFEKIKVDVNI